MTPVQLPEVPAHACAVIEQFTGVLISGVHPQVPNGTALYTAAQLREYATEAVMADRSSRDPLIEKALRIFLNTSRVAEWMQQGGTITELVRLEQLLTPSETNSER